MNDTKYVGLDVHQATVSVFVLKSDGKLIMESSIETKAETILQFIHGLGGSLQVTFEEGTCAAIETCYPGCVDQRRVSVSPPARLFPQKSALR
jgi:hypothetical protein